MKISLTPRSQEEAPVWAGEAFRMDFGSNKLLFPLWELLGHLHESWTHVQHAFQNKIGANVGWLSLAPPFMRVSMLLLLRFILWTCLNQVIQPQLNHLSKYLFNIYFWDEERELTVVSDPTF